MPNRIIKESICTSDTINDLGWFEEVLFYRLIVNCDDFGRFDGRMAVIKNRLFPLKDNLTFKSVEVAVEKLARAGLITRYEIDGRPYLFLPTWNDHQSIRARKSKYPEPHEINCKQLQANEINCKQMKSIASKCSRNPIQSESNPNTRERTRPHAHTQERKHTYGSFDNVYLTEEEYDDLTNRYGECAKELIEKFSCRLKSHGYRYEDHYATILDWANQDSVRPQEEKSYNLEEFFAAACRRAEECSK